jgi:CD9 antigen
MAGKGDGEGEGNVLKLENQIYVIKYVILFTNIIEWMIGASIFALCLWLRFEPGIGEFLEKLDAEEFYIGVYVLIVASIIIMIVAFIGCISALQESSIVLLVYIGTQVVAFIFGLAGSAVLLDNSARDSHFQPRIRESMRRLIINAHHEPSRQTLAMIQEGITCCGADGASDYLNLKQPLPNECRDSVTGNPFYHGCVDELTWFFEQKCAWVAGLAMTVCFFHVSTMLIT